MIATSETSARARRFFALACLLAITFFLAFDIVERFASPFFALCEPITQGKCPIDGLHIAFASRQNVAVRVAPLQKRRCALTTSGMGFIFQTPGAAFNPIRSYKKQFIETLKSHDKYDAKSFLPSIKDVFSRLGLQDCERILASCPYEMSGGMNQRIALALVILMQQKLLLADEPTSALDAVTRRTVADELIAMRTDCGIAQMIVTHDFALASYVADRIAVMHCGRIVELAPAKELVSFPLHPYTRMLLEAVPALGGSIPTFSDAPVQSAGKLIEACAGHFVLSEV